MELYVTRVTTHSGQSGSLAAARVARRCSPSLSSARLARRSPSHLQRPAVTRHCLPQPAAGRHGSHSPRPAVTRRSPPGLNRRCPGAAARLCSPQPASLPEKSWRPILSLKAADYMNIAEEEQANKISVASFGQILHWKLPRIVLHKSCLN